MASWKLPSKASSEDAHGVNAVCACTWSSPIEIFGTKPSEDARPMNDVCDFESEHTRSSPIGIFGTKTSDDARAWNEVCECTRSSPVDVLVATFVDFGDDGFSRLLDHMTSFLRPAYALHAKMMYVDRVTAGSMMETKLGTRSTLYMHARGERTL